MRVYELVVATAGQCLTEAQKRDPVLQNNLATVAQIFREYERYQQTQALTNGVLNAMLVKK